MGKPRNTRKYPTYPRYPGIPESKKGTQKYPIVFFDTPTRPEPDPLPGILSNTRPDPILKNPTRWALLVTSCPSVFFASSPSLSHNHLHILRQTLKLKITFFHLGSEGTFHIGPSTLSSSLKGWKGKDEGVYEATQEQGLTGSRYPTSPELFFKYPTRPDPKIENDWVPGN